MPFNMAILGVGGRTFILAISAEDLAISYNIEAQIASEFPNAAPTIAGDRINLSIAAVDLVAASMAEYAIDGDGVHDDAILTMNFASGALIAGKGGQGGKGGLASWLNPIDRSRAGFVGKDGGTAIRLGCETRFIGTGTIEKGYGGGGGGGAGADSSEAHGGGGGGGGFAHGDAGNGGVANGSSSNVSGDDGVAGDMLGGGAGGDAGGLAGGPGGDGGDSSDAAQAGTAGNTLGGIAGSDGDAINSQGFTHSEAGGITVTGDII